MSDAGILERSQTRNKTREGAGVAGSRRREHQQRQKRKAVAAALRAFPSQQRTENPTNYREFFTNISKYGPVLNFYRGKRKDEIIRMLCWFVNARLRVIST